MKSRKIQKKKQLIVRKNKTNKTNKTNKNNKNNKTDKGKLKGGISRKNNVKLEKVNCSPKEKGEINNFSCYTDKSLFKLRDLWNARHPDNKITTNNTKDIHKLLT